jgi:hypothetical protein
MVSTSSSLPPFRSNFLLGNEKSHTMHGQGNMEVATHVGFHVCLRNFAQIEKTVLVCCHDESDSSLTTTFLVACSTLSRRGATELVNNIPYLLCDPLERNHCAQCGPD